MRWCGRSEKGASRAAARMMSNLVVVEFMWVVNESNQWRSIFAPSLQSNPGRRIELN